MPTKDALIKMVLKKVPKADYGLLIRFILDGFLKWELMDLKLALFDNHGNLIDKFKQMEVKK